MNSYIVRQLDHKVIGFSSKPLNYSVSGLYIVDIDSAIHPLPDLTGNSVSDLLTAKEDAYKALTGLTSTYLSEEHTSTKVEQSLSSKYISGFPKKTELLGLGSIVTSSFALGGIATKLYCHWKPATYDIAQGSAFDPSWTRYNWDAGSSSYINYDPSLFTVELRDLANSVTIFTFTADTLHSGLSVPNASYRLRFTNTAAARYTLSDWYLLWDV